MKSIKSNYKNIQESNPNLGTYPCLVKVVKSKKFSRKSLVKAFSELMSDEDYEIADKKELIDYLEIVTNMPEEGEI